jgi:uncharacterized protein
MDEKTNALLARIADALDRLAPVATRDENVAAHAYRWTDSVLCAVDPFSPIKLDLLTGVDAQKDALLENGRRLSAGHGAHDILLWGARGAGKSALVKSTTASLQAGGCDLRLVEAGSEGLQTLPALFAKLSRDTRPTILFIDDLGFDANGDAARHLRSLLDGGVTPRPDHVRLYVTSNRRHILARDMAEQNSAINPRDSVDDHLALADRFGLSLGFHACSQDDYLKMVAGYTAHLGVRFDPADALLWSTQRGARSGRVAWHYATELAGRAGKKL